MQDKKFEHIGLSIPLFHFFEINSSVLLICSRVHALTDGHALDLVNVETVVLHLNLSLQLKPSLLQRGIAGLGPVDQQSQNRLMPLKIEKQWEFTLRPLEFIKFWFLVKLVVVKFFKTSFL
jgi:hypothetical protein